MPLVEPSAEAALTSSEEPNHGRAFEDGRQAGGGGLPPHFLARLAHDLRSPLGLLSGDLAAQLDAGHERLLLLAHRGLARLDRMARTLSTVAQLEGQTLRISKERTDLSELIREVVESVELEDPRRGLTVEVDVPEGTVAEVDPVRFQEAIWEIVAQARRQAASAVCITLAEEGDRFELRIEDDGRGFEGGQRRHAFDRFHEPADRRGTGLGLSVARDLIRAHGGDIVLTDSSLPAGRPGTLGSCFVVSFPR